MELLKHEAQRARWRRYRHGVAMADPGADDFASRTVVPISSGVGVRLLVLPGDPDGHVVEFDGKFWNWWAAEHADPVSGGVQRWGEEDHPTQHAAVRGYSVGDGEWSRYVGALRCGGLEMALGRDARVGHDEQVYFRLIQIVGRAWGAIALASELAARYDAPGPWEITLALAKTSGSQLANVGEGWAEPYEGFRDAPAAPAPGVLLRRELDALPEGDELQALALSLGGEIEDAWHMNQRRFLASRGDLEGRFDTAKYGWWS